MTTSNALTLKVTGYRAEALDVISIELRAPNGGALPPFAPGSHLEVTLPPSEGQEAELIRHYSLCNSSTETHRYVVAVARAFSGRGGSLYVHERLHVGMSLEVKPPRNNFPLHNIDGSYRFVAGGIGITPIMSMIAWCESNNKSWTLLYCARNRLRAAFYETLCSYGDKVKFHFDDESGGEYPDIKSEIDRTADHDNIYCCGPQPLMQAVREASENLRKGQVNFEWFTVDKTSSNEQGSVTEKSFEVVIRSSGAKMVVDAGVSILETLEKNGVTVPFSCREGLCRSCETSLCEGEADHRDYVLSDEERNSQNTVIICVSRAKTGSLTLDV